MNAAFLLTSLVVVLAPGAGVFYTLAVALSQGARASLVAAAGCTLGILPAMGAAIFGAAVLLQASLWAFGLLKVLGCLYLLWMARGIWRAGGALASGQGMVPRPLRRVLIEGFALNILNPKLAVFFLAFLPQFVPATASRPLLLMLGLSATFMAMTFAVFAIYGLAAARARRHILTRPAVVAWLRHGFALAFLALAARLLLARP